MTDSQAADFVTFNFKGSCVCYFLVDSTDHRMNFFQCTMLPSDQSVRSKTFERNTFMHIEGTDINVKRT